MLAIVNHMVRILEPIRVVGAELEPIRVVGAELEPIRVVGTATRANQSRRCRNSRQSESSVPQLEPIRVVGAATRANPSRRCRVRDGKLKRFVEKRAPPSLPLPAYTSKNNNVD
jgi:hypothetical protein